METDNMTTPIAAGPLDRRVGHQAEFYCGQCGLHKSVSCMVKRPAGRTPICRSCDERAARIAAKTDAQRERARLKVTKRGTAHLMHNARSEALPEAVASTEELGRR